MSEASSERLLNQGANARANTRETVKWLATAFAAVAAVVMAGTSISGVSRLDNWVLVGALSGGALGLGCVLRAIGVTLRMLTHDIYLFSDISNDDEMKNWFDHHSRDVLPPSFETFDSFFSYRESLIADYLIRGSDKKWQEEHTAVQSAILQITDLANTRKLQRDLRQAVPKLFFWSIGAMVGLGIFAVLTGSAKPMREPKKEYKIIVCEIAAAGQQPL